MDTHRKPGDKWRDWMSSPDRSHISTISTISLIYCMKVSGAQLRGLSISGRSQEGERCSWRNYVEGSSRLVFDSLPI
ncbi:hypothetical protein JOB18_000250 [Solea senegalensis]|uniref:Uncharacterized protein n=1 Tax=Solea senegalensis TaxID=28829 RepID=A0AAV6QFK3_SOLSE|nr:hypothetical protein JOB18_000250 [Solea senegalensis]